MIENKQYSKISSPEDLQDALTQVWCAETCAPRLRDKWSSSNRSVGQCSVTAFIVQDIFGGEVRGLTTPNGSTHCYNVIEGVVYDLTRAQFGAEADFLVYDDNDPIQDRNSETHFGKEEKRQRYLLLKKKLEQLQE